MTATDDDLRRVRRIRGAIDQAIGIINDAIVAEPAAAPVDPDDFGGPDPAARGTRTTPERVDDYRAAKAKRGECRDCRRPVKIKSNGKPARTCAVHAAADNARHQKASP